MGRANPRGGHCCRIQLDSYPGRPEPIYTFGPNRSISMGSIDIRDGAMARSIRLRALKGDIEIEFRGDEPPLLTVPEEFEIERK